MVIKTVTNSDTGTTDLVGGNDWDNMVTAINLGEGYKYLVVSSGGVYYIKNSAGEIIHSGTNPVTEIQWAFDNLTVGRTWPEKIILKGDFVCGATILYPSYYILEVQGRLKLADAINAPLMQAAVPIGSESSPNRPKHIYIKGGEWDGNKANNTSGSGYSFLAFYTCEDVWIENVFIHDTKGYAIIFEGCWNCGVHASHFKDNGKMGIAWDGSSAYGIGGKNCLITHCYSDNADINAFWGHGYGDEDLTGKASYGFTLTNCIASNSLLGIYLDERLYGYAVGDNFAYGNGDGASVGAGIFINGENDGVPYYHSRWSVCSGNVLFRNANDGIEMSFCAYVKVSDNIAVENSWDGIAGWGCHDCDVLDNLCCNNDYGSAVSTFSGIHFGSRMGETIQDGPHDKLYPLYNNRFVGNRCQDTQGTKTQTYGVHIYGVAYNNEIRNNWVNSNKVAGIKTTDLSYCYDNVGFKTKRSKYYGTHPTDSTDGFLTGLISTDRNAADSSITKTIDSSGTRMTFTTSATTNNDTCGGRATTCTERDQFAAVRITFKAMTGSLWEMFLGFHSTPNALTTIASILASKSGAGLYHDTSSVNWRLLTNNGAGSTTNTDTTINGEDGTKHEILIMFNETDSAVLFVLDGTLLTGNNITTGVPAAGTDLGLYWQIQTLSPSAPKTLDIWEVEAIIKSE